MTTCSILLDEIGNCQLCAAHLPLGPRPVLQAGPRARILIAGQAPGRKVHETGLPFNDPSGDRLRHWLGVTRGQFYDPDLFALVPMGFCYPGTGKGGDLPPRPECALHWRAKVLSSMLQLRLTLLLGQYAQAWHLKGQQHRTLTATVAAWRDFLPGNVLPLPHPSPRNIGWFKSNPWFEAELVPVVRQKAAEAML
ncbi:MAG: uracil-DNA glycosylase family protein [Hyphomicrobium sp.]|mgnify:CR=1 FL=1